MVAVVLYLSFDVIVFSFFYVVRVIALEPYGGSHMIASKTSASLKEVFMQSILMIVGLGNSYYSKFNMIFGFMELQYSWLFE